jgi:hypothetical protein
MGDYIDIALKMNQNSSYVCSQIFKTKHKNGIK